MPLLEGFQCEAAAAEISDYATCLAVQGGLIVTRTAMNLDWTICFTLGEPGKAEIILFIMFIPAQGYTCRVIQQQTNSI